jgi:haloalkane dehalogenase
MDVFRTPDERFEGLPDFDFEPQYREVDGLRLAHLDVGEGEPVVFFHGEPTWSYLWRKVIPPVRDAGFRCIAPDYAGFGRSDKPTDFGWYSYDRHVELVATLLEDLDLRNATAVVHDWGGPIGLRLAVEHPDRVARLVIMNTGIGGGRPPSDEWLRFRDFVRRVGTDLIPGKLVRISAVQPMSDEVEEAYNAPWPVPESKAGILAFPDLVPISPEHPDTPAHLRVRDELATWEKPTLVLFSDSDPIFSPRVAEHIAAHIPGALEAEIVVGAGHFLQEDRGEEIGARIRRFVTEGI